LDHSEKSYLNWFWFLQIFDVIPKITWHQWRQIRGIIVIFWDPTGNFVQHQENAWSLPVIVVVIFLSAWSKSIYFDVTNHARRWSWTIITIVDVLATTGS
jgi:hypothetical protein